MLKSLVCTLFLEPNFGIGILVLNLAYSLIRTMLHLAVFIKWWDNSEESVFYWKHPRFSFSTRCLTIWSFRAKLSAAHNEDFGMFPLEGFLGLISSSQPEEIQPEWVGRGVFC